MALRTGTPFVLPLPQSFYTVLCGGSRNNTQSSMVKACSLADADSEFDRSHFHAFMEVAALAMRNGIISLLPEVSYTVFRYIRIYLSWHL
jgi:hypothetical protein